MEPDNRLMGRSGLFDAECVADFTGNNAAISRMMQIYRWLEVHPVDHPGPGTIADEPDKVNSPYGRGTIDAPDMNPEASRPAILLKKMNLTS